MTSKLTKQIVFKIDDSLNNRIDTFLDSKKRSEYPTKTDLIRKAIEIGMAELTKQ
jgi:hypothetical protein